MQDHCSYDYAVVRVVPRVDREEFVNAGVIVSCPARDFLDARIELDQARLLALDGTIDLDTVRLVGLFKEDSAWGSEALGGAIDLVDLFAALGSPEANDVANFSICQISIGESLPEYHQFRLHCMPRIHRPPGQRCR